MASHVLMVLKKAEDSAKIPILNGDNLIPVSLIPPGGGSLTLSEVKADTDIADALTKKHSSGSDNQDLSGKVDKVAGSSLVADTEIAKIHANTLDHSNASDHAVGASIAAAITDGDTTHSPDGDVLFHALAAKGTSNLALGDLAANAYYGDKGKTAYDHSQVAHAPTDAQKNSDISKAEIEAKLTGEISSHTHAGGGGPAFPIGSVFISVVSTDPATLLGYGTWSSIGAGRVLVGLDSGDVNFDTVEETGGAKTSTPDAHAGTAVGNHAFTQPGAHTMGSIAASGASAVKVGTSASNAEPTAHTHAAPTITAHAGGAVDAHGVTQPSAHAAMSIIQPYFVVYMWKRTA